MTRDDVLTLTGRELDVAVAEKVMGFVKLDPRRPSPPFSTNDHMCRLMEAEIERRGMHGTYAAILYTLVLPTDTCGEKLYPNTNGMLFAFKTAPLDVCCRAALLCVLETKGANHAE